MERKQCNENPMMGISYVLTVQEEDSLTELINICPIKAFKVLNKKFNAQGFCIAIGSLPKEGNVKLTKGDEQDGKAKG